MVSRQSCAAFAVVLCGLLLPHRSAAQAPQEYLLGPQDVLSISVWDQPDLGGKFTVEADGTFTFPLIGRIKAGGLTLRAFEAELRKRLSDGFFKNPEVSVAIEQYHSQRVFVVGEVRTPGPYQLTGRMSLIEILSRAGSTLPTAADEALIVRPSPGSAVSGPLLPEASAAAGAGRQVLHVDINDLQSGINTENLDLRDGDTIYVPRAPTAFVSGQVKNPGEYPIKKATTILQALSLAGGVTDRGSTGRVKILRVVDGKRKELKAQLSDPVQGGDTIIVDERFF